MLATFITLHFPICFTTAFLATGWFTSSRCPYVASATPARAKLRRSGISGQGTPFASTAESAEQECQKSILKELNYRKKYVSKAIISEWDCMRLYCFNLDSGSNDDQCRPRNSRAPTSAFADGTRTGWQGLQMLRKDKTWKILCSLQLESHVTPHVMNGTL
jgi:hypothetical protein